MSEHPGPADGRLEPWLEELRADYNAPPPTPREEIWARIEAARAVRPQADVIRLDEERALRRPATHRVLGWAVAAAAVLMIGVGIGRMTAPTRPGPQMAEAIPADESVLRAAAVEHFGRAEAFLTLVRADARNGALDPDVEAWAKMLLGETRLFLDSPAPVEPTLEALMEDLELVLVQILGVAGQGGADGALDRTEMDLALRGLEGGEVLTRIQAVSGPILAES